MNKKRYKIVFKAKYYKKIEKNSNERQFNGL